MVKSEEILTCLIFIAIGYLIAMIFSRMCSCGNGFSVGREECDAHDNQDVDNCPNKCVWIDEINTGCMEPGKLLEQGIYSMWIRDVEKRIQEARDEQFNSANSGEPDNDDVEALAMRSMEQLGAVVADEEAEFAEIMEGLMG